jgi:uncharacterized membrane protein SirB2
MRGLSDTALPMVVKLPALLLFVYGALGLGYLLVVWVVNEYPISPWALVTLTLVGTLIYVGTGMMLLQRRRWARNVARVLGALGALGTIQALAAGSSPPLLVVRVAQLGISLGILIPLITKTSDDFFTTRPSSSAG